MNLDGVKALPDFLIIGAAKCGTTSLYYHLRDHPEVFCPAIKELNYFSQGSGGLEPGRGPGDKEATTWISSRDKYEAYFRGAQEGVLKGEASVSYLYSPASAKQIHDTIPKTRLIIILRDPVERAWSNYCHMVRDGRETVDFMGALRQEDERIRKGWEFSWHYRRLGLYGKQLKRYLRLFPESQIKIFRFVDLKVNTSTLISNLFSFLGVDATYDPDVDRRHNRSGQVRSSVIAKFINRPNFLTTLARSFIPLEVGHRVMETFRRLNMKEKPSIPEEAEAYLSEYYATDTELTEKLTNLDLSHWKSHE